MDIVANEIWREIFGHLAASADLQYPKDDRSYRAAQKTLSALCLVSWKFCNIAQPLLHRNFVKSGSALSERASNRVTRRSEDTFRPREYPAYPTQPPPRENTSLENFLRTIIQRPDLALSVKNLYIERFNDAAFMRPSTVVIESTLADTLAQGSCAFKGSEHLAPALVDSWKRDLRQGVESAEIALLLTLVPSLRWLHLCHSKISLGQYVQQFCGLTRAPLSLQMFPLLSYLNLEVRYPPVCIISLDTCVSLITLPTLRSIRVSGVRSGGKSSKQEIFSSLSRGQLRYLELKGCRDCPSYLADLVESCTRLESLTVDTERVSCINDNPFTDNKFLEAIKTRAGTLKSLTLLMKHYRCESQIWDLRPLVNLQHLEIDMNILLRNAGPTCITKCLPVNIESLRIRRTNHEIVPHFETVLASRTLFTNLKLLEVGVSKVRSMSHAEIAKQWADIKYTKRSVDGNSISLTFWDGYKGTFMNNRGVLRRSVRSSRASMAAGKEPGVLIAEVYFEDDWHQAYLY